MSATTIRAIPALGLTTLLLMSSVVSVTAAEKEPAVIESVKGEKLKMAGAKMAKRVTRFNDTTGDQVLFDGTPAADAPRWTDLGSAAVAAVKMNSNLLEAMADDFPPGASGAFYGSQAAWEKGDLGVFLAVKMDKRLPGNAGGQQIEIGLGGDMAMPVQSGTTYDTRAGVERFTLGGLFSNGAMGAGTTDVSGRQPGEAIEYYDADSGIFGFYAPKSATWFAIVPRTKAVDSVAISVRSNTDEGEVIDRLELPGGGHFVSLSKPAAGFSAKSGSPTLDCRSLETFSADSGVPLSDPEATLIRYTAGMDADHDLEDSAAILASAVAIMGPVDVALASVGSEDEPTVVTGELAVAPLGNAVSLTFEAPAGQWSFALAGEDDPVTPAGQRIFDHDSLTGQAGLLTGPGLDGFVAGDLSCAIAGSEIPAVTGDDAEPSGEAVEETAG